MVNSSNVLVQGRKTTTCETITNPWMVNDRGDDPCTLVEKIAQVCSSASTSLNSLGAVSDHLTCPSSGECCCSSVTYSLLSACWVCQGHKPEDIDSHIIPAYQDFFQASSCPVSLDPVSFPPGLQSQMKALHFPSWALIPPESLIDHWNFTEAKNNGSVQLIVPPSIVVSIASPETPSSQVTSFPTINSPSVGFSAAHSPPRPTTIVAAVLCSLVGLGLMCVGGWFFWRWRRRHIIRLHKGARVDLADPEIKTPDFRAVDLISESTVSSPRRERAFPFPYEGIVPHHHLNALHSYEPSRTDETSTPPDSRALRRHTAPVLPSDQPSPMEQLERDLATLRDGGEVPPTTDEPQPKPSEPSTPRRRAVSIASFSHSSTTKSSRAWRKTGGGGKGRYFHLPPSAQYLSKVALYPHKVDPERPWNIRHDVQSQ